MWKIYYTTIHCIFQMCYFQHMSLKLQHIMVIHHNIYSIKKEHRNTGTTVNKLQIAKKHVEQNETYQEDFTSVTTQVVVTDDININNITPIIHSSALICRNGTCNIKRM